MTWGWSHTAEAYANAQRQVEAKDRKWLVEVWSEIQAEVSSAAVDDGEPEFNEAWYAKATNDAEELDDAQLAAAIWEYAEMITRCDNGGFNAHCCPWGCHTVPFDPVAEHQETQT